MNERTPPDFDSQNYARPNDPWICGHACEGKTCRLGPDNKGRCQATAECVPVLETKPGEAKGRWRCTRSTGPCESGPLPDGSCCHPVAKCSPRPSLRLLRGRLTLAVVVATCAALLILLGGPWRGAFINPGPLSDPHSSAAFAALHSASNTNTSTCAACHRAGASGPAGLTTAALRASPAPWELKQLAHTTIAAPTTIDASCQTCHTRHAFHQGNAPREVSCSYCHTEHRGTGRIPPPTDSHCALCHGDQSLMTIAATKSGKPDSVKAIHSFTSDHPDFRIQTEKARDPGTIKFNHALHLTGETIPKLPGGNKLDCTYCHQPDSTGAYLRPVKFENHCRTCHSLQFDANTPELHLPHGDPAFVSAFLRSLPKQYADTAARSGISNPDEQKRFAERKLAALGTSSGEEFERRIFFSTAIRGPHANVGTVSGAERALFPGCAYCHEVKAGNQGSPQLASPKISERWLHHARFDHSKHSSLACTQCHDAAKSRETADIVLPAKAMCATCHSPAGGVHDSCVTCHTYHHTPN